MKYIFSLESHVFGPEKLEILLDISYIRENGFKCIAIPLPNCSLFLLEIRRIYQHFCLGWAVELQRRAGYGQSSQALG